MIRQGRTRRSGPAGYAMPESPVLFSSLVPACGNCSREVEKSKSRGERDSEPTATVARGPQSGRWRRDPQHLDSSICRLQIRRNKARMSMKTKDEVKKSRNPSPGSLLSPPSQISGVRWSPSGSGNRTPPRRGPFDRVRFLQPPARTGSYARNYKNRGNELNKLLRINDLSFLTLENELGLMCKIGPIQAKKREIGEEEVKQKGLSGTGAPRSGRTTMDLRCQNAFFDTRFALLYTPALEHGKTARQNPIVEYSNEKQNTTDEREIEFLHLLHGPSYRTPGVRSSRSTQTLQRQGSAVNFSDGSKFQRLRRADVWGQGRRYPQ